MIGCKKRDTENILYEIVSLIILFEVNRCINTSMKKTFTIMIPIHRGNLDLANECLKHLLDNSDIRIVCIDDFGRDDEYIQSDRISFIHNTFKERQPLVKLWNQCIKACPTDNVIIASWRQRPTRAHFTLIEKKLRERYGMVTFDGLHFFSFNK